MSGSTSCVTYNNGGFNRGHTHHNLVSRGLSDDVYAPSIDYHSKSLEYSSHAPPMMYYDTGGYRQIQDDVADHGGRRQMGGDKSPRHTNHHRLTQSYHSSRPHPPSYTNPSYAYHPPTTSLAYNHTPSSPYTHSNRLTQRVHRNHVTSSFEEIQNSYNGGGRGYYRGQHENERSQNSYHGDVRGQSSYHGDDRGQNSYHGDVRGQSSYHGDDRGQNSYHGDVRGQSSYHGDDRGQNSYHGDVRGQSSYHGDDRGQNSYHGDVRGQSSYHGDVRGQNGYYGDDRGQNPNSYYGDDKRQCSYHGDDQQGYYRNERGYHGNERSQRGYHGDDRGQNRYYKNDPSQQGYHGNERGSYHDDRHSDLTTSVMYSRPLNDWYSQSWSSPNNRPHPLSKINSPSIAESPSEPHPDSSPPTTMSRPQMTRSTLTSLSTHLNGGGVPYINIISHPEDVGVPPNGSLILKCEARLLCTNEATPIYQWYKDEEPLCGEVESILMKEIVSEEDLGFYFCIVSDVGMTTQKKSRQAYVYLDDEEDPLPINFEPSPPVIVEQPPANITILTGTRLHLKLHVTGTPEPVFRWFRNNMELPYASASDLVIQCVTVRDEGKYVCSIRNDYGSILSRTFNVKLLSKTKRSSSDSQLEATTPRHHDIEESEIALPPSYTAPSSPQKLPSSLSFKPNLPPHPSMLFSPSVETTPTTPPDVQVDEAMLIFVTSQLKRQVDSFRISQLALCLGVATYDLSVIKTKYTDTEDQILQVLTSWKSHTHHPTVGMLEDLLNMEGFIISLPHHSESTTPPPTTPTSGAPPVIIQHPRNPHVTMETVMLSVMAEGESPLSYQWYRNNIIIPQQTRSLLYLSQPIEVGIYHCTVTNYYGKATSHPAFVGVVNGKPKPPTSNLPPSNHQPYMGQKRNRSNSYLSSQLERSFGPLHNEPLLIGATPRKSSGDTSSLPSLDSLAMPPSLIPTSAEIIDKLDSMKLDKGTKPVILEHPQSQDVAAGEPLHLAVLVDTPDSIKYVWYFNGLALCKEKFSEFFLNCFTEEDVGDYYCEVSNNYDTVKSDIAKIALKDAKTTEAEEEKEIEDNYKKIHS